MNVFYLGPAGTFTHDAAQLYFKELEPDDFKPCGTPTDVIRNLIAYDASLGVVPIENSIHGEVIPTLDALLFEFSNVFVVGEVSIPISFNWYGIRPACHPGTVISHPHALAQCKRFVSSQGLVEQAASSTAEACRIVSERGDSEIGAIASPTAGARFGLHSLQAGVEDYSGAHTRFLILGRYLTLPEKANRTMLALLPPSNKTGVLAQLSGSFADAGVNIFGIHNRPLRTGPGHYLFIITIEGSGAVGGTRRAIERLLAVGYGIKLLGIYEAWPGGLPAAPWPHLPGLLDGVAYTRLVEVAKGSG